MKRETASQARRRRAAMVGQPIGTSIDDISEVDARIARHVYRPDDGGVREPRVIPVDELIRRVRSLRSHAGYVVRECNELLADLGADDVSTMLRGIGSTFDGVERATVPRVDAGDAGTFDEPDTPRRRKSRGPSK